jgi:hypothetical protein
VWRNKQLDEGKVEHVEGTEQNTEYRYAIWSKTSYVLPWYPCEL